MATQKNYEKTTEFKEHIEDILKCSKCIEPIISAPIHQCTNGHVICKDCVAKLNNCPICKNDPTLIRNLIVEQIIEKLMAKPVIEKSEYTPENRNEESGSAVVSFSNNGPNRHPDIQINIPQNSTPVARNAVSTLELISKYRTNVLEAFTRANTHVRPFIARVWSQVARVWSHARNSSFAKYLKQVYRFFCIVCVWIICILLVIIGILMFYLLLVRFLKEIGVNKAFDDIVILYHMALGVNVPDGCLGTSGAAYNCI